MAMDGTALVAAMAATVEATAGVCRGISEDEWARPTGCPGWSVRDVLAHLVGLEVAIMSGVEPDCEVPDYPHVRDATGQYMERHVEARRGVSAADLFAEYESVFAQRLADLSALPKAAFAEPTRDPFGSEGPLDRQLKIRVFDLWAHEQDIRRALNKRGGLDSAAAQVSVEQCKRVVGPVLGSHMPDGSTLALHLDGPFGGGMAWSFDGGRASALEATPTAATVTFAADTATFTTMCCGRSDARPDDVRVSGDTALAATLLSHLAFTP